MPIIKHTDFEVPGFGEFAAPPAVVPSYAEAINALGPLAYWRLGEQAGTSLADQAGTHPLTLSGGYTLAQPGALLADDDGAIRFNSAEAVSVSPVLPTGASDAFSIVLWIRKPSTASTSGAILRQFESATTGHLRLILLFGGGIRYALIGDSFLNTSASIDTSWKMFVLTRSAAGTTTWYVDGEQDVQATGHDTAVHATALRLGTVGSNVPDVLLDEVALFDDELTPAQVRWLHGLGVARLALPPS